MRSSRIRQIIVVLSLGFCGFVVSTSGSASSNSAEVHVPDAMRILVTSSGLRHLESDVVGPFLKDIGWDPEQWDATNSGAGEWKYRSDHALRLDELPAEFIRYRALRATSETTLARETVGQGIATADWWFVDWWSVGLFGNYLRFGSNQELSAYTQTQVGARTTLHW